MIKPLSYRFGRLSGLIITCCVLLVLLFAGSVSAQSTTGTIDIQFIHTANGKQLTLRDSSYANPFGEAYTVNKLKYYVGHFSLEGNTAAISKEPYFLVNAAHEEDHLLLTVETGTYHSIGFTLGVDSIDNCSGAQSGALDPLNDMFWTWNSGYIFFKLEGTSPASGADLQRIEHHIGGYKGDQNVASAVQLTFPENELLTVAANKKTTVLIETNLDHYWNSRSEIRISAVPAIMTPGPLSKKIAANFSSLFSVKKMNDIP